MDGKKRVLITGGTGYIGSSIVAKLLENESFSIALIVRDENRAMELFSNQVEYIVYNTKKFKTSITDFSPHIVLHLAAYSTSLDTVEEMTKLVENNIIFTSIFLDALSQCQVELFINTGSFSEFYYNNDTLSPTYYYSATKIATKYIVDYFSKKNNFKYIHAILYTVYGKKSNNKKIIDYALDSLESITPIKMSDGNQILDFVHIDDVVSFYMNLIVNYVDLNITLTDYHVGTAKGISIREMVTVLENITEKKANIEWASITSRPLDTIQAIAKNVLTEKELHWRATLNLQSGLVKYVKEEQGKKHA